MKKKMIALLLALVFIIPGSVLSFADNAPSSLEAPKNLNVYVDNDDILIRWTLPQSIADGAASAAYDGDIMYFIDWKVNDGPWHYDAPKVRVGLYRWDTDSNFFNYVAGLSWDADNVQEIHLPYYAFGYDSHEQLDLANNKYTFRMRFAFEAYGLEEGDELLTSPYSNEVSIGKGVSSQPPKTLDATQNLKAELKYNEHGKPYFLLNWTNPESVSEVNENFPVRVKIDFKVGTGKWYSETVTLDWMGSIPLSTSYNFDPVEEHYTDRMVIEENVYYIRIMYIYESVDGKTRVVSPYSNVVSIGTPKYESASSWAVSELDQAAELGFITDTIKGKMNGPITREEFAEVVVNFYEIVTGKKAEPHPTEKFSDTANPAVLKARNLNIVYGVGEGKFAPKNYLTREQMAAMITRTISACYTEVTSAFIENDVKNVPDFKDQAKFDRYGIVPAKFMAKYKITVGIDNLGNYGPKNTCTREQAVIFLYRAYLYQDQYIPY